MTWSENLQRDLVDACQSVSGSESEKAKFSGGGGVGRRVGVVEMVAGGWSFAARDQDGGVYVWGEIFISAIISRNRTNGQGSSMEADSDTGQQDGKINTAKFPNLLAYPYLAEPNRYHQAEHISWSWILII
jgi:hypothetical protein